MCAIAKGFGCKFAHKKPSLQHLGHLGKLRSIYYLGLNQLQIKADDSYINHLSVNAINNNSSILCVSLLHSRYWVCNPIFL